MMKNRFLSAFSFTYPLVLHIESIGAAHRKHWCSKSKSLVQQTDPLIKPILKSIDCVIL